MSVSFRGARRPLRGVAPVLLSALGAVSCGGGETPAAAPPTLRPGTWRATLGSPGGPLTFGVEFLDSKGALQAVLVNGEERRPAGVVREQGDAIEFELPPYRSRIVARVDTMEDGSLALVGRWERDRGEGLAPVLAFAAIEDSSIPDVRPPAEDRLAQVAGRWRVDFAGDDDDAVGIFEVDPTGRARGTFLTTLGDYRYLAGWFDGTALRLSCFDGAHAFLFDATLQDDGSLAGDFWSRDSYHDTWTAKKDPDADLPDYFSLTSWTGSVPLSEVAYPALDGEMRTLDDPSFDGSARILVVFGTWCPNCNDLTEYLVELDERYDELAILGLAFEFGEDVSDHRRAVREYLAHHGADYPVLLAGTSDKAVASEVFPLIDRVRAYPTTVFMDADGTVAAVHTGFSGPATGARHGRLRERFENEIERLLATEDG